MIYLLYGENSIDLKKYIDNLIKSENITNVSKYNFKENELNDILEDAYYMDLFGSKKAVIVENALFLTSGEKIDTTNLEDYINNSNPDTYLFLTIDEDKLDERKKIVKLLKEKSTVKTFEKLDYKNIREYIKNYVELNEYKIEYDALNEFIFLIGDNTLSVINELDKLMLYKIEEKVITKKDVNLVVSKNLESNVFKLVEAVKNNNKEKMFEIYKDLCSNKIEPVIIVSSIANQFRIYLQVKIMLNDGLKENEITKKLGIHPYRVKLAIGESTNFSENRLFEILDKLVKLDLVIKTNSIDKNSLLETFFMTL